MKREQEIFPYIAHLLNGAEVEWKPLGEIASMYGGLTGKNKTDFEEGNASYITYKNIFDNIEIDFSKLEKVKISSSEKQNKVKYGDILFTGSSETAEEAGMSSVVTINIEEDIYLNSFSFGVRFNEDIGLLPEFTKYLFRGHFMRKSISKTASGVTRFNISKERFKKIQIPIPPLSVQQEIVRILDKFTQLEAELKIELETELDCRKRQYEYYRDMLLTFNEVGGDRALIFSDLQWKTLGEVVETITAPTKLKRGEYQQIGKIPIIDQGMDFIAGYTDKDCKTLKADTYVLFGDHSENIKYVDFSFIQGADGLKILRPKKDNAKYIYYAFFNFYRKQLSYKRHWSVAKETLIPIPPIEEQERIAGILDKFDTLVNSISEGLPREIELRRKQYEYYREKLLSFPKN